MDESLRHLNSNPMLSSNIFSRLLFRWLNPLFEKGRMKPLEIEDMFNVSPQDSSDHLGTILEREWQREVRKGKESGGRSRPSLLNAMIRLFGLRYMLLGFLVFIEEGVRVVQPLLLGGLIRYFTPGSQVSSTHAYLYAASVSLCAIIIAITHHPFFFGVTRMGMQMRVACCSLMYRKALRLSNTAMGQTTTGQIVNLMSNDVNRFDQAVIFLHFLWIGPLQCVAVLIILWHELGPSVLAGFAVLLLLMPVQASMGKLFSKLRRKTAVHTDERVKVMNEIIAGMRVIKMYCWEKPFGEVVEKIRRPELRRLHVKNMVFGGLLHFWHVSPRLLVLPVLIAMVIQGQALLPGTLFMIIMVFNNLSETTVSRITFCIANLGELRAVTARLQNFLQLEDVEHDQCSEQSGLRPKPEDCGVVIDRLTAKWNPALEQNTLDQISASVKAGQLLAVIGPVGAGKSSLLMAILGELQASSGTVSVRGKMAYVAQQPWIFSGSLRQNILFGSTYDKSRFDKVVRASAMHKDLEVMPHGDSTLIGDRGVSLSGGQRARVSLARALYMDADIYLLDDPLSAVDAAVGRHLFDKCIQGALRKKGRILVTHQLQYLAAADSILILNEGRVEGLGTFEQLSNSGVDFAELLKTSEGDQVDDPPMSPISDQGPPSFAPTTSHMSLASTVSDLQPEPVQQPEEEERQKGTVGLRVYVEYFKNGAGPFKFFLLIFFNLVAQGTYILSDWWLSVWSNAEEAQIAAVKQHEALLSEGINITNITIPAVDSYANISIFTAIIVAVFVFGMVRALLFFKVAVDASRQLHNSMFSKVLRSPITFFDINPVGRILNRFAKDVGHMDDNLPLTFYDFIQCLLMIVGIVLVAGVVNPWVFIPTTPLIILFFYIRNYYLSTSRSIKRLEGTCRSPVFSYLSASLQGLHTIRACGMEKVCEEEFDAHQNLHSEAWFLFLSTSRWLAIRLDWLCALFVTTVTFASVLAAKSMDAGLVGLSITYAMTLMGMFQWGVRQSAEVENQMISVERVLEYSRLPSEANLESDEKHRPPATWPSGGAIMANNLCLKYFPNAPLVLKDLTFRIKEQEKVGIVGRTGAGKSSLITSLFRLVEPCGGQLVIDGVDILHLGLHDLRKIISIIPQDPMLFTGTLRRNLDPFLQHSDSQLWKALEEVQLKSAVEDLPAGLETLVSEGGVNFSVGQRQLICLARAILRRNPILLIDEATANVDPKTDELIQETIRDKFRECTVLTIAHRLHTIMDSDRVMVLSEGRLMEFEAPHLLLQRGSGLLYDMVQQTGKADAEHLVTMAAQAYSRSHLHRNPSNRSSGAESSTDPKPETKRRSKGPSEFEDMNVSAPMAVAESFHSLLGGGTVEEEDDSGNDNEQSDDRCEESASEHSSNITTALITPIEEDTCTLKSPTEEYSTSLNTPTAEESVKVTVPTYPSESLAVVGRSTLTDMSLDDEVFAEDHATLTTPDINFLPASTVSSHLDSEEERGEEEELKEEGRQEGENDGEKLLLCMETGSGKAMNSSGKAMNDSSSDMENMADTQTETPQERSLHADTPPERNLHAKTPQERSLHAETPPERSLHAETNTRTVSQGASPGELGLTHLEMEPMLGNTSELCLRECESLLSEERASSLGTVSEARDVEDCSELDALLILSPIPDHNNSVRS